MHSLDTMKIDTKGKNNYEGCCVDRTAERGDLLPDFRHIIQQ